MASQIQDWTNRLQAIAQNGIAIKSNPIITPQLEEKLNAVIKEMTATEIAEDPEPISGLLNNFPGYPISRTTVRGAVFKDNTILLVRAPSIGRTTWALPGGSTDINEPPSRTMIREIREETGFLTETTKLVGVSLSNTADSAFGANLFFQCKIIGGQKQTSDETDEVVFFTEQEAAKLETWGPTSAQVTRLFAHDQNPLLPTEYDTQPWIP